MKFLLNENKFILNEASKFILEERFSLEEGILLEAQATLKQLVIDLNKLNTLLPDLLAVLPTGISLKILDGTALEGEKLDIETEIQSKCTEIQDLLKTKKNLKELIDQIRAKAELPEGSFTEEEVKSLQPLCYSIANEGTGVKDILKSIKGHKGELAKQVVTLQDRLPKLKTGLENLYKFFETSDKTSDSTLSAADVDWEELYKKCGSSINSKEAYDKFWNGGLPTDAAEAKSKNLPIGSAEEAKGYFKAEWGNYAALVRSFGAYFIRSLLNTGWTQVLNPYVELLQHLFKLEEVLITDTSFAAVDAMYKEGKLSENDLRGKGKLGELNLVRNAKLYAKPSNEIRSYLSWQYEAKNSSAVPSNSDIKTMFANIVVNSKTVADLKNEQAYNLASQNNFQYEIRPLTKYKELIKVYLKADGDTEKVKQATDKEIAKILSKITTSDKAKKLLTYLVNLYRVKNLTLLTKFFEKPFGQKLKINRERINTTFEEDKDFDKLLDISTRKYSEKQLESLITELIKIARI